MYDALIVGAGPAGSQTAAHLAARGARVLLVEEHPVVGSPPNCSGVLGVEAFRRYGLPPTPVVGQVAGLTFHGPGGASWGLDPAEPLALVVDRRAFDPLLADRARALGAEVVTGLQVHDLRERGDRVVAAATRGPERHTLEASVAVLATGSRWRLARRLGFASPAAHLFTAQAEVPLASPAGTEIFLGQAVAPGSFGWIIPIAGGLARVGITARRAPLEPFRAFCRLPAVAGRLAGPPEGVKVGVIPLAAPRRTVRGRILLVGHVAGQVKLTTGGGIYYALRCGEIAAAAIGEALGRAPARLVARLEGYDGAWRARLGAEHAWGARLRAILEGASDAWLDRAVREARGPLVRRLVERFLHFDWHAPLIARGLAHPGLLDLCGLAHKPEWGRP
jgi:geranylgeranyl reductase family protein